MRDGIVEPPLRINLRSSGVDCIGRAAAALGDRSGVPGHGHAGRKLCPLPVASQALAGVELTLTDEASRKWPSERRVRHVLGD
jgi:hypothetical protein